jgi:hypothetical protein
MMGFSQKLRDCDTLIQISDIFFLLIKALLSDINLGLKDRLFYDIEFHEADFVLSIHKNE